MKLDRRQLTYFTALCKTGHFGRAAELTNVTQPALSIAISEMELELGQTLIDRSRRPYRPTPFGRELLTSAHRISEEYLKIEEAARGQRGTSGNFRLGVIPTVAPYLLPGAITKINTDLPDLRLQVRELQTDTLVADLENGEIDAGIIATDLDRDDLRQRFLFSDKFLLAMDHGQVERNGFASGEIHIQDVVRFKLLLLAEGHCLRDQTLNICRYASKDTLDEVGASSLQTLAGLASTGYGVTLVPEIAVQEVALIRNLKLLRLADPQPERQISLVWRKSLDPLMSLRAISDLLTHSGEVKIKASCDWLNQNLKS